MWTPSDFSRLHMTDTRKPRGPSERSAAGLTTRLQEHEAALLAIPGVTGCGVGLAADGSGRAVIQVFVAEASRAGNVRKEMSGILRSVPAEVVVMPLPSAD